LLPKTPNPKLKTPLKNHLFAIKIGIKIRSIITFYKNIETRCIHIQYF